MRNEVIDFIYSRAREDKSVILLTGDLGYGVLDAYIEELPNQFINVGVAEQNLTGIATGLSMSGNKVFTYSIGNFNTLRCLEQIRNGPGYHELDFTIISVGGGYSYGQLGFSHHATEDYGILRTIPNMNIYTPGSVLEAIKCVKDCFNSQKLNYLRLDKSNFSYAHDSFLSDNHINEIFKGDEVLLIGSGGIVEELIEAKTQLETFKVNAGVLSISRIKPLDVSMLLGVLKRYKYILTLEEHNVINGIGQLIKVVIYDNNILVRKFESLAIEDKFLTIVGDQKFLRKEAGLDSKNVVNKVLSFFGI
jgi:transketolase